jgi:hypothetical protein
MLLCPFGPLCGLRPPLLERFTEQPFSLPNALCRRLPTHPVDAQACAHTFRSSQDHAAFVFRVDAGLAQFNHAILVACCRNLRQSDERPFSMALTLTGRRQFSNTFFKVF